MDSDECGALESFFIKRKFLRKERKHIFRIKKEIEFFQIYLGFTQILIIVRMSDWDSV